MNTLKISEKQFEQLIALPIVRNSFTYFIKDDSYLDKGIVSVKSFERGIRIAGIEFVVEDGL